MSSPDPLTDLLRQVSRSFYLTLRVLPRAVRPQIGLAYLLARTTDTIADTGLLPVEKRLEALRAYRDLVLGTRKESVQFEKLAGLQDLPAEKTLLERAGEAVALLDKCTEVDREEIRAALAIISSGQELDLVRFGPAGPDKIIALASEAELDDYTYRVAGCVGEFWTRLCRAHLFPDAALDEPLLLANGVRFGKGLQLVNILRDLPRDLRQGRCYLPREELESVGLAPGDLLDPSSEAQLGEIYQKHLDRAACFLEAGWKYTLALPRQCRRLQLGCAWPILIGIATIRELRRGGFLDPKRRIKISRVEVRKIIALTVVLYPFRRVWARLFERVGMPQRLH